MIDSTATLREIALKHPATIRVFERLHLDYCCGGRRPLAEVCAEKALDETAVRAELEAMLSSAAAPAIDFASLSLAELGRHIVATHHAYIRNEVPRLAPLIERTTQRHGETHPEVAELGRLFRQLGDELLEHIAKEEMVLFPYIEALERSQREAAPLPHACFDSVASPVQVMLNDHENAGALLAAMRAATHDYTLPADACPTLAGLYDSAQAFERDLHQHIHLENNLQFPRAIALEAALRNHD